MPYPTWQEFSNAAVVEFDLAKLPERVQADGRQLIAAEEGKELDGALRALFILMQRTVCFICYNPRPERNTWT